MFLSDGYIANGSEPWKFPDVTKLKKIKTQYIDSEENFLPYKHDEDTLARKWAIPGVKGLEHRIGGLEKANNTGNVNYDPDNHHQMVLQRQKKVDIIENFIPDAEVYGEDSGDILVVGWGGTYGSIRSAVVKAIDKGLSVSHLHLKYINPFPKNLGDVLLKFDKILIPELNLGQLLSIIRAKFLVDAKGFNKVQGKPFSSNEILMKIENYLKD